MSNPLRLFEGYGVELEYMIVDQSTLDVRPIADQLLAGKAGEQVSDLEDGAIGWSNELVLHVLEFKTNGPATRLEELPREFTRAVADANEIAKGIGARLMPTAMHPWMDPLRETQLWPHDYSPVYAAFDSIFGCSGHGWSNLQSTHLNLPFAGDDEFGRLHAAIRAVLPLLPALAASSPLVEERNTGIADNRLAFYRTNAKRIPSVTGAVVPEPVFTREVYERDLLGGLYRDIAPFDPDGLLQEEWLNARGAIARFDRMAIEIRVLDVQECPSADLAIVALTTAVVKALCEDRWVGQDELRRLDTTALSEAFTSTSLAAGSSRVELADWLRVFGLSKPLSAVDLWTYLLEQTSTDEAEDPLRPTGPLRPFADRILREGCLSKRITNRLPGDPERGAIREVYEELCDCLAQDRMLP
ncbi:MAG: glutamate--cysteine ligase [Candidatus Eisenbacteria bacterium]|uniref:Glutamate--cysteine ligase n=1 Tax=Eiseniibacteriota bacterium TaxID=2212470 RepID=A0A956NFN1_UNCEI|nr:glutamate--cysteine ligase [Candidatus Eisenbacteria bacterium]